MNPIRKGRNIFDRARHGPTLIRERHHHTAEIKMRHNSGESSVRGQSYTARRSINLFYTHFKEVTYIQKKERKLAKKRKKDQDKLRASEHTNIVLHCACESCACVCYKNGDSSRFVGPKA